MISFVDPFMYSFAFLGRESKKQGCVIPLNAQDAASPLFKLIKETKSSNNKTRALVPLKTTKTLLCLSRYNALLNVQASPKVELGPILGHALSAGDAKHCHLGIVPQACE